MTPPLPESLEASRRKLLGAIAGAPDVTFVRLYGNVGDQLIFAGIRQLLRDVSYREIAIYDASEASGHTAILSGGGNWCWPYHDGPDLLCLVERRFHRVIVFPSSFDVSVPAVRDVLRATKATVFAREEASYNQIRPLCQAELAHDCAFFFDYAPYRRAGRGVLNAFRTDLEAAGHPRGEVNVDVSLTCETLDEWLWTIARHELVRTDRAHVLIAAALLGKQVEYRPNSYHKVSGIVDYSLRSYPVRRLPVDPEEVPVPQGGPAGPLSASRPDSLPEMPWPAKVARLSDELADVLPADTTFLLVDDNQLGTLKLPLRRPLPFLERQGVYWGPPADDETAVAELQRTREAGVTFLAFAWTAFWWLEHYAGFHRHLRKRFPCVLQNDRLVVFDLRR
jgi:exopolysaccharide biosynthesis predicted pyruvyltransferase EpsI